MLPTSYSLSARWIHPVSSLPLESGFVNVRDGLIESVGSSPTQREVFDFGEDCRILPGVVNAHAHLELSQIPQQLDVPLVGTRRPFVDWIDRLMAFRRSSSYNAEEGIWTASLLPEILSETVAIGDIVPPIPTLDFERLPKTPERISFYELIAWTPDAAAARLDEARRLLAGKSSARFGLSPHAPQTVHRTVFEETVRWNVPLAVHLAESPEEIELLRFRRGPLLDLMRRADPNYDPESFLVGDRPLDYLKLLSEAERTLIVHGNYLDAEEIAFIGKNSERMSVVYCPRTHAYFGHSPYPLRKMLDAGVCLALGTDSLASSPDLSLLNEIKFLIKAYPDLSFETVVRMGTLNGARALGIDDRYGTLEPGKTATFSFWTE